ncbi:hypothetical protein V502_10519 [Pseudogymnoascus sp. VKM F-4520 (FW-2644)]|nr:hypothetical protein V502_10519 [Pseudogymnoascus sp. VKM F-4520 (FW-2644)]
MTHNRHDASYGPGHLAARIKSRADVVRRRTSLARSRPRHRPELGGSCLLADDRKAAPLAPQQQEYPIDSYPTIEQQPSASIENHQSNLHVAQIVNHNCATEQEVIPPASVEPVLSQLEVYDSHSVPMDMSQHVFDNIMNEILFMPNAADFNNQILDFNLYDFTFQDEELDAFAGPSIESSNNEGTLIEITGRAPRSARDVRAGYAAFTRSPWLWTPAQRDCILRDKDNLTLDEGSIFSALTPPSGPTCIVPSCGFPTIKSGMRDKMYHLVSTMNNYTNRIPDFPSLDVLNHVVEAFFVRQTYQIDNWIHVPSMSLLDVIPELGLALVVAGSTVISVPAVWKMGLVLHDVVRVKLGELWDRENSATRRVQPLQAWILVLDAGLWSGFQRQMELSESFGQTMVTMMRRGGIFGAAADTQSLIPHESDTGQVLEAKWKKWTERESFKRASIVLQKSPLISVTEITFSLPASRSLFLAGSAIEWKLCFDKQRISTTQPSLQIIDVVHDLSIIGELHSEIDIGLCCTVAIHAFWCQIWAFRESWKFHAINKSRDSIHHLWLVTQQRELYQQLEVFGQTMLSMQAPQAEQFIVVELLLMILHVSTEELQHFAGKYGEEAASVVLASLERWSGTEQARRAVWHAGQVFRWASLMPRTELRDFYAIAVYFASLALWTFGHLSSPDTPNGLRGQNNHSSLESDSNSNCTFLAINSEDISGARSFIAGRQTTPVLVPVKSKLPFKETESNNNALVRLDDPNMILQMAQDLYRSNFQVEGEPLPLPPLVENMANLMRDLGSPSP